VIRFDRAMSEMMKSIFFCVLLAMSRVVAAEPAPTPLDSTVDQATHIVIGTVRRVSVVSFYNNLLYRLSPEPRMLFSYTAAQLEMDVDEVLYPPGWKPTRGVKYLFGDGMIPVADIRGDTQGQRRIFFMREQVDNKILDKDYIFYSTDTRPLGLPEQSVDQVRRLVETRIRKEQAGPVLSLQQR